MALEIERAARDMSGALDHLCNRSAGKLGVTGYCLGGGLALYLALHRPKDVAAVVPYYGLVPRDAPAPDWSKLQAAVQGHYAEHDHIQPERVRALEAELYRLGKEVEIYFYPGTQHAFANDNRSEAYNAEAAELAWGRTLDFFRGRLI